MTTPEPRLGLWQMVAQIHDVKKFRKETMATWSLDFHTMQEIYFSNRNTFLKNRNSVLLNSVSESERNLIPSLYLGIRPYEINMQYLVAI